jgi:hypothetical protein
MRLAIGFVALGCMLVAELVGGAVMYQEGQKERIGDSDKIAGGAFAASLLLFCLVPWLLIVTGNIEDVLA